MAVSVATGFATRYVGEKIANCSVNQKAVEKAKLQKVKNIFNNEEGAADLSKVTNNKSKPTPETDPLENVVNKGGSKTGTVWDNIKATQDCYPNTNVPRSFEVDVNGQKM